MLRRVIGLAVCFTLLIGAATALDINSSKSLQYYSGTDLDFEVNETGGIFVQGPLDMGSSNTIQNFFTQGTGTGAGQCEDGEFVQYVYPDGTYECQASSASAGNTYVNITGDEMTGRLNMSNNSINNISVLHEFGEKLRIGGNVYMQSNTISGLADPTSAQDAATKSWVEQKAGAYNQTLAEVLREGAIADRDIFMGGNSIHNIQALSVNVALTDGNISEALSISSAGDIDPDALNDTLRDDQLNNDLTINNQGDVNPQALARSLLDSEVYNNITISADGSVDPQAITGLQGAALTRNGDGSLDVNAGWGLTVNANTDTINLSSGVAGTDLNFNQGELNVVDAVTRADQLETIAEYWRFNDNVTIAGDLNVLGNITESDVQQLNVNGSLLPPAQFDQTFDVGASGRRWRNGRFANNLLINGSIHIDGTVDGVNLDSPGNGIILGGDGTQYVVNTADSTLMVSGGLDVNSDAIGSNELVYAYESGQAYDDRFVNESGDTMEGDLDFNTNAISDVGSGRTNITNTGNIEVGGNIDVNNNEVQNVLSNSGGDAVNQSYVQDYVTDNNDDADSDPANELQNLSEVLTQGNEANQSINMTGDDIDLRGGSIKASGDNEVCIGDQCA